MRGVDSRDLDSVTRVQPLGSQVEECRGCRGEALWDHVELERPFVPGGRQDGRTPRGAGHGWGTSGRTRVEVTG